MSLYCLTWGVVTRTLYIEAESLQEAANIVTQKIGQELDWFSYQYYPNRLSAVAKNVYHYPELLTLDLCNNQEDVFEHDFIKKEENA